MEFLDVYTTDRAKRVLYCICKERAEEGTTNISFELPTWADHCKFVDSRPYEFWYLIHEGRDHGYIGLTKKNEIGIVLLRDSRKQGIGKRALSKFLEETEPLPAIPSERRGEFVANINPQNQISMKLFEGFGFQHIQNTYVYKSR